MSLREVTYARQLRGFMFTTATMQLWLSLMACATPSMPTEPDPSELCDPWKHLALPLKGTEVTLCNDEALHAQVPVDAAITPESLATLSRAVFDAVGKGKAALRAIHDARTAHGLKRSGVYALTSCRGSHHAINVEATTSPSQILFYSFSLQGPEITFAARVPDGVVLLDCNVTPASLASTPTVVSVSGLAEGPAKVRCSDGTEHAVKVESEAMTHRLPAIDCALVHEDVKYPIVFRGGRSQTCTPTRPGSNLYDCI